MTYLICLILFILCFLLSSLSLYLIYKSERLEDELDEQQGLIDASRKSLANAEERITQRNKLIGYQRDKLDQKEKELNEIKEFITSNNYGNAEIRLNKLKELIRPQNQN